MTELQVLPTPTRVPVSSVAVVSATNTTVGPVPSVPKGALTALIATLALNGLSIGFLGTMLTSLDDAYPEFSSAVIGLAVTSYFVGSTLGTAFELLQTEYRSLRAIAQARRFRGPDGSGSKAPRGAAGIGAAEVAGAQSSLVVTLFIGAANSVALFVLPHTVNGSHSSSFVVYLMLALVLGWTIGVQLTAVSTVIAAWDVRVSAQCVNITNFAFSIGAVAASWIQSGFVACGSTLQLAPAYDESKFAWLLLAAIQFVTAIAAAVINFGAGATAVAPAPATAPGAVIVNTAPAPSERAHVSGGKNRRVVAVALGMGGLRRSGFVERRSVAVVVTNEHKSNSSNPTAPASEVATASVQPHASVLGVDPEMDAALTIEINALKQYSRRLLTDRRYWMLLLAMCLSNGVVMVTGTWLYSVAVEQDMADPAPTIVASLFWAGTVAGRLVSTQFPSANAVSTHRLLVIIAVFGTAAPIGIALGGATEAGLIALAGVSGLVYSCVFPLLVTLEMQCQLFTDVRSASNAVAVGVLVLMSQFGAVTLPTVFGAVSDAIGSKRTSFFVAAGAMLLCLVCILSFPPKPDTAPHAVGARADELPNGVLHVAPAGGSVQPKREANGH